ESRQSDIADAESAVNVTGPLRVRIAENAKLGIFTGHPGLVTPVRSIIDVQSAFCLPATVCCEADSCDCVVITDSAPHPAFSANDANRRSDLDYVAGEGAWYVQKLCADQCVDLRV